MKKTQALSILLIFLLPGLPGRGEAGAEAWGFFAHQRINHLAVFALPQPLAAYFKKHIDFLTIHAVDPDKRRYAVPGEAERHFIDLDVYGDFPFDTLPRSYREARAKFLEIDLLNEQGDTSPLIAPGLYELSLGLMWFRTGALAEAERPLSWERYLNVIDEYFISRKGELKTPSCRQLRKIFELPSDCECKKVLLVSLLDKHGILPWHLLRAYRQLVKAFETGEQKRILKQAADIGHYIADAHVPLHTTKNYNGQLSGQEGIHAFWESRLPELFSDSYDFFVGPAKYIEQPADFFWEAVFDSHRLVDSVLTEERALRQNYPAEEVYCYEERGRTQLRTTCRPYAEAYHQRLHGMVERRMRAAIHAVASIWYSAYVEAGSPVL